MIDVKLNGKKVIKDMQYEARQSYKRLTQVSRREIRRGGQRYVKEMQRHMQSHTGVKLTQKAIKDKSIKTKFINSRDINKMRFIVNTKQEGFSMIHFVAGTIKNTTGPKKTRKSPYVRIYKGRKVRLPRSFILRVRDRKLNANWKFFFRSSKEKYTKGVTPSIVTLLKNSGFDMDTKAGIFAAGIRNNIMRSRRWILAPFD